MKFTDRILVLAVLSFTMAGCGGGAGNMPAVLSLSQSSLAFNAAFGGQNPAPATVNVSVSGNSMATSFTATSDSPWLSVTPASGTAPDAIQISVALGTFTTATYTRHITVTASGVQGSPATG